MVQLNDSFFVKNDEKDISNWDASEKDWANAGNHRLLDYTYLSKDIGLTGYEVTNPKDEDLDVIKAAVNDGHILSITTWISGFELKNIQDTTLNPANKDFTGEVYITKIKSDLSIVITPKVHVDGINGYEITFALTHATAKVYVGPKDETGSNVDAGEEGKYMILSA